MNYVTEMTTVRSYSHNIPLHEFGERITVPQTMVVDHGLFTPPLHFASISDILSHPVFRLQSLRVIPSPV